MQAGSLRTFRMFLWWLLLGSVLSAPAEELSDILDEGERSLFDEKYKKYIVPSGFTPMKSQNVFNKELKDIISEDNENYQLLQKHIESGHAMKGLTFNIYDDNMRETAVALYRILKMASIDDENLRHIKDWAIRNINKDIVRYAFRLVTQYRDVEFESHNLPPFISKPNFYVNSETINKALKLKVNNGKFDEEEGFVNQYYREDNVITINTNYSGWNLWNSECEDKLDYFREDIGLNSYYFGIHIVYPSWMANDELTEINLRYAENYYYMHKQLITRYNLEKEHLRYSNNTPVEKCLDYFNPYLVYENGLSFPIRSNTLGQWNDKQSRLKSIDIAIKECLARGFIYMDNGVKVKLTEDNYVDLLAKLLRANYESPEISKVIKSLYGYGQNGYPIHRYNPAPSVLHHPETTLRDPVYWNLMENLLKYFIDYSNTLEPYELSKYDTGEIEILNHTSTKIVTYFDYYKFNINSMFGEEHSMPNSLIYAARQKRLKFLPFALNFTVNSLVNMTADVKLFLGPRCKNEECWNKYSSFYELDAFGYILSEGITEVSWSSERSLGFSFDDSFNLDSGHSKGNVNGYNLFKFPENLAIPRGLESGLNLTLFVIIRPQSEKSDNNEPFGFPFHRPAVVVEGSMNRNFGFYDITIFHKETRKDTNGRFSAHIS